MLESNAKQIELICNGRGYLKIKKNTNKKDGDSWTTL